MSSTQVRNIKDVGVKSEIAQKDYASGNSPLYSRKIVDIFSGYVGIPTRSAGFIKLMGFKAPKSDSHSAIAKYTTLSAHLYLWSVR